MCAREIVQVIAPYMPVLMELKNETNEVECSAPDWEKVKSVWGLIKPYIADRIELNKAAQNVADDPESSARLEVLRQKLEELLEEDSTLAESTKEILKQDSPDTILTDEGSLQNQSAYQDEMHEGTAIKILIQT